MRFTKGQFAEKTLREVPSWYVQRCIGDTTNDGFTWAACSPEEQTELQAETARRTAAAVAAFADEKKRLAANVVRRAETAVEIKAKIEADNLAKKQAEIEAEAKTKLEAEAHAAEVEAAKKKLKTGTKAGAGAGE